MATTPNYVPATVPIADKTNELKIPQAWLLFFQRLNTQAANAGAGDVTAVGTLTDHEVVLGDGTTTIRTLGTTGVAATVLTSHGPGVDPQWDAVPVPPSADSFGTVAVSGQSDIVADAPSDTLTIVAGTGITLTTDAATDTLTIEAAGGTGLQWSVLTNGDVTNPELIFAAGDVVMLSYP